jgi:putative FmdB family regulatory protein
MPTYEYECTKCRYVFEEFQSITADPLSECPKCGKAVRRLIGAGMGIIFKGSGFYTTDYKKTSTAKSATTESKTSTESEKKPSEKANTQKKTSDSAD